MMRRCEVFLGGRAQQALNAARMGKLSPADHRPAFGSSGGLPQPERERFMGTIATKLRQGCRIRGRCCSGWGCGWRQNGGRSVEKGHRSRSLSTRQQHLPPLPVPSLQETAKKFVDFAKLLETPEEHRGTIDVANKFLKNAGRLQTLLENRAKQLPNWLTPWWLNVGYLEARHPLPIVTSPGLTFPHFDFTGARKQIESAAKMIQAILSYHHLIRDDKLREDRAGSSPLDMSQYKLLFGTTRIPQKGKDRIQYGRDFGDWPKHILVTRNGHTFHFPVYSSTSGEMLTLEALQSLLERVVSQSETPNPHPINVVSSGDRDSWADVYDRIKENNPSEMDSHERALFVMCLDKECAPLSPSSLSTAEKNMCQALHGGGTAQNTANRWFDKALQFYLSPNGSGGMTYEHTPAEGPPLAKLLDYVCDQFESNSFIRGGSPAANIDSQLRRFDLNLGDADKEAIVAAAERINNAADDLEVRSLAFDHFGKNVPKAARLSPDSFVQLALQLTFRRLHRFHPPTYETGTLRKFCEGRTDTIRLPNEASIAFVDAMCNQDESGPRNENVSNLGKLLAEAVQQHKDYSIVTMNGGGMDRHLLGLKQIAIESSLPLPSLFDSSAYKRLLHFQVSTSQLPTRHPLAMGFGPSAPDCYGCCYNPQEQRFFFTVTAFNSCVETSASLFAAELEIALLDMHDVLYRAGLIKPKSKL